ncbi:hypothetical protein EC968_001861 [Mortierella alpina]|nr:hypothetical protein EC968_001861 [Mortierella alpina]
MTNTRQKNRGYGRDPHKPLVTLEPIVFQHTLYYPGNIPLVITAGHGGSHQPGHIVQLKTTHRFVRIPDLPTTTDPITVGSFTRPVAPAEGDEAVPWMSLRDQSQGGNFKKDLNTHAMALNLANAISCLTRSTGHDDDDLAGTQGSIPKECEAQGPWGDDDSDFPFPTGPSTPSPSPSPSPSPTLGVHSLAEIDQQQQQQQQENLKFDAHHGVSYPHVIVFRVSRRYVDVNRNLTGENAIAEGDPVAEAAWREYHDLIDHVQAMVLQEQQKQQQEPWHGDQMRGGGLLLDIHGHAHSTNLIEIGYLLDGHILSQSDEQLNAQARNLSEISGIRSLISRTVNTLDGATDRVPFGNGPRYNEAEKISFSALIRGRTESLGGMLQSEGLNAVPSPNNPAPCQECIYFFGGHTVQIHGSQQRSNDNPNQRPAMDAIQLELPKILRLVENPEAREIGMKLGSAVVQFMARYYGVFTTSGKINDHKSDKRFENGVAKAWSSRQAVGASLLTARMLHQHRPPPHQPQHKFDEGSQGMEPWESSQSGDGEDDILEPGAHMEVDPNQRRLDLKRQSSRL